ncbi:MAG TPA: hypothetical protein VG013_28760 [Gemmataceae bacterium]|jgi:hypothetical protein|nr:hypothetical protein [Gemmataceae bacterium]
MEGHQLDEDGEHDEQGCYQCLLSQEVKNACRCGECCHLVIEAGLEDADGPIYLLFAL